MHFPLTIEIFRQKIFLHLILELLAFFIGYRYYLMLRKKAGDKIAQSNRIWILIGASLGALAGSRVLGGLENPEALMQAQNKFLYFYANKTVLGGFLGGLFGVELIKKIIGEKNSSGDLFTFPIILALIIGRIGCFSMGVYEETYGNPTNFITGMDLGDGLLRHPAALYEIVFLCLLWVGLAKIKNRFSAGNGMLFKLFLSSYCIFRFLLDYIKPHYTWCIGLSAIQIAALLGLIYYAVLVLGSKAFNIKR
ncbi:MAG: prolipoprotein diacylglyceryl transferase family protein [Ferruginibacter sp.]